MQVFTVGYVGGGKTYSENNRVKMDDI